MINRMMIALACAGALSLSHADVSVISTFQVTLPDGSVLRTPTVQNQSASGVLTPYIYSSSLSTSGYGLTYSFLIGTTADAPRININYSPFTQKITGFNFSNVSDSHPLRIISCLNQDYTNECLRSNIQISTDRKTGYVKLNFSPLEVRGYNSDKNIKISGTLEGYINHPIETIDDIPKKSNSTLRINQKPVKILYAAYEPYNNPPNSSYHQIITEQGDRLDLIKKTDSNADYTFFMRSPSSGGYKFYNFNTEKSGTTLLSENNIHSLTFNNLKIPPYTLNSDQPTQEISGNIRYPIPSLSYIISPWLASGVKPEINRAYNPAITLSSDGFRTFHSNSLIIKLLNRQIYSIAYKPNHLKFTPNYYCQVDVREGCSGVTVNSSGWRVRFDQTPLSWRAAPKGSYGANINIYLRGNFEFAGR